MQLAILTAVLAAIASAEAGGGPVGGLAWRFSLMGLAACIAPLAALVGTRRLAASASHEEATEDALVRVRAATIALWLAGVALMLLVAQWPQIVRSNWQLASWPLVDEVAILLPVVASLWLAWAALDYLEQVAESASGISARAPYSPARLLRHLWLESRHQLGLVLLPPLLIVGLFETLAALKLTAAQIDTAWWLVAPLMATSMVIMPVALRRIWRTTPLPSGPTRDLIEAVCRERKAPLREILVWHTDGTIANAALVGVSRYLRYILLTDRLLARLSAEQLAAVVRHELGHLRRWHLPLRLAVLLLPVAWWLAIQQVWPAAGDALAAMAENLGIRPSLAAACGIPVVMLLYTATVVGRCSRWLEHDADLDACLSANGNIEPALADHFCRALAIVSGRRRESRFGQWLHPPVASRIEFLDRALGGTVSASDYRRRLLWVSAGVGLAYLPAIVLPLLLEAAR